MRMWRGVLVAKLVFALLASGAIMQSAGCSEVKFGGETAEEVFKVPGVVALAEAGCAGDLAKMDALAEQGVDVNATDDQGGPVLWWIWRCKNYAGVEKLLSLGANPNYKVGGTESATWLAAGADDPKWLSLMLAHGGDPNIWSGSRSALMVALQYGRMNNFQLLLAHGADVNAHDSARNSAATNAAAEKKYDMLIELIQHGYNYQLIRLARAVNNTIIPPDSKLSAQKMQILGMLKDRGVEFPIPPFPAGE